MEEWQPLPQWRTPHPQAAMISMLQVCTTARYLGVRGV